MFSWNVDRTCEWLSSVGFGHLSERFADEEIDGPKLMSMDQAFIRDVLEVHDEEADGLWNLVKTVQTVCSEMSGPMSCVSLGSSCSSLDGSILTEGTARSLSPSKSKDSGDVEPCCRQESASALAREWCLHLVPVPSVKVLAAFLRKYQVLPRRILQEIFERAGGAATGYLAEADLSLLRSYDTPVGGGERVTLAMAVRKLVRSPRFPNFVADVVKMCTGKVLAKDDDLVSVDALGKLVHAFQLGDTLTPIFAVRNRIIEVPDEPVDEARLAEASRALMGVLPEASAAGFAETLCRHPRMLRQAVIAFLALPPGTVYLSQEKACLLRPYGVVECKVENAVRALSKRSCLGRFVEDLFLVIAGLKAPRNRGILCEEDLRTLIQALHLTPAIPGFETVIDLCEKGDKPADPPLPPPAARTPIKETPFRRLEPLMGDQVVISTDVSRVKRLMAELPRLSWADEMEKYCGTEGTVRRVYTGAKAGKVQVQHADGVSWTWPVAACLQPSPVSTPLSEFLSPRSPATLGFNQPALEPLAL